MNITEHLVNMKKYVIINTSELSSVDYSLVEQDSENTVRRSLDGSLALVSFFGSTPSFLNGKTEYNKEGINSIITSTDWELEVE